MNSKQLKYSQLLNSYPDCPKSIFKEIEGLYFRWVQANAKGVNDFLPINLIKDPPQRILDNSDLLCMGFGLSLFDTNANAFSLYSNRYNKSRNKIAKENFILEKGTCIAQVKIEKSDGIADEPSSTGHFTFHEYLDCDLKKNIQTIFNIFDSDENIKVE